MEDWKETPLSEITSLITKGTTPSMIGASFTESGIKYIKSESILDNSRILDSSKFAFISLETHNRLKRSQIEENDLLFSMAGMFLGKTAIVTKNDIPANTNQAVAIIRIIPNKADFKFIYYYLNQKNIVKYINNLSGQSAQPNINLQQIGSLNINLPPLPTQQKIAQILSSLDDKIELNNKINANLEQQAQALFKSWFVDFEPFGGEELVESPINSMIPKSLKMIQIADIPHVLETGKRPKGGAVTEGIPSIGAENVKQLGVFDYSSNKFIPEEFAIKLGKGKINGYELLLYKDGGKPGTFIPHFSMFGEGFPYEECYINEHVFKLDFGNKGLNEFAYFYFNTDYVKSWLANNGGKAAIPGINQNNVNEIWIYDLENPKVKEFGKIVEPLFKQIFSNCKQNKELASIRDTLLPKLMNGEIEV